MWRTGFSCGRLCCRAQALGSTGSVVVAHGLSCSAACGIFPDQGSNLRHLHWLANSQPLGYQGNSITFACFVFVPVLSHIQLFATPWTVTQQAPISMEFSRQEYWSGLPFPSPGDVPDPETEPTSCISCVGRQIPYHWATGKPNFPLNDNLNPGAAQTTY